MLGRVFVLLPIVHAVLCYLYLYFFSLGFGGGVLELATVGDILSIGLGKILPFYLSYIASIILTYLWMEQEPLKIEAGKDTVLHPTLEVPWFHKFMTFILFAIPTSQVIYIIFLQKVDLTSLGIGATGVVAILIRKAVEINGWKRRDGLVGIFLFLGLSLVSIRGYTNGFHDRTDDYAEFVERPMICRSQHRFLFASGEYKIAVDSKNFRVAFDSDCKIRMLFQPQQVTIELI